MTIEAAGSAARAMLPPSRSATQHEAANARFRITPPMPPVVF